jgi:phosphoglucosamine mutase
MFGTDGIRGKVNQYPMTWSTIHNIGRVISKHLLTNDNYHKIFIGKDPRPSSDFIECALCSGLKSWIAEIVSVGVVSTATISYLCKKHKAYGIMITASHNPEEYNGIKIFDKTGKKISKKLEWDIEFDLEDNNHTDDYIDFLYETFKGDWSGISVMLDGVNGVYSNKAGDLLVRLGIQYTEIFNGRRINEQANIGLDLATNKGKYTCGIQFDGDGDRCLIYDEKGDKLDGDDILWINYTPGDIMVGTDYTNRELIKSVIDNDGSFVKSDVGDREVAKVMKAIGAPLGGEQSGHIIFGKYQETGDGLFTALMTLKCIKEKKKPVSALKLKNKYEQVHGNIKCKIEDEIPKYSQDFGYRTVVRKSGTEPVIRVMVEARYDARKYFNKIMDEIQEGLNGD